MIAGCGRLALLSLRVVGERGLLRAVELLSVSEGRVGGRRRECRVGGGEEESRCGRRELEVEFGFRALDKPGVRRSSKLTPEGATLACAISALRGRDPRGLRFVLHNAKGTKVVVSEPISSQSQ
jgi:hypothetical protein